MSTGHQIKIIHTLKGVLGIDDADYRALLGGYGVSSSTQMTVDDAANLIRKLQDMALARGIGTRPKSRFEDLRGRPGMATPEQLRKIEALWVSVSRMPTALAKREALQTFVRRFGVDRLEWLPSEQVSKVIKAIISMKGSVDERNNIETRSGPDGAAYNVRAGACDLGVQP